MSGTISALEALARAFDKEEASQRGEPDPWKDAEDDAEWVSERLACAQVAEAAYLAARSAPEAGKAVDDKANELLTKLWMVAAKLPPEPREDIASIIVALRALASAPAPSGAEPPDELAKINAALAKAGIVLNPIPDGGGAWHYEASAQQAVPAEDIAGQAWQELVEKDDRTSPAEYPDMALITRGELEGFIGTALTILSTRLDWAESGQRTDNINSNRYFEKWQASEAEATSLRRKLEEAERQRDDWKATHGRVIQGFAEVCEAVGVQFDAPDAVAYAINAKIGNAEHDLRAAERKLQEHRKALEIAYASMDGETCGNFHRIALKEIDRTLSGASE